MTLRSLPVLLGVLLVAAACAAPSPAPAPAPAPAAPATVAPAPAPTSAAPVAAEPAATSWVMPDLVGANLQDAQNAIQSLTDFAIPITTSTDATGAGRQQVLDRNWTVCAQNVSPGETITSGTAIDFAAVKLEESC
ncbi:PASTA domain-containing protein [Pseudonocardia oceani]|nr:PASTA domain-containing protein [Pseudonocardia oceani]